VKRISNLSLEEEHMAKQKKVVETKVGGKTAGGKGASFTDTRRVQELIELMAANGLSEIELVEGDKKIALRRGVISGGASPVAHGVVQHAVPVHIPATGPAAPVVVKDENEGLVAIKSPMVGTFYSAANPDSDPFVAVGTQVSAKTVVCIIEAMKVFNEIPAEISGTVVKVLASNGQAVEFGQALFMVKPG
jgi:acetyl-CoA carboxylase biotin carboxyl carrier protein